MPYRKRSELPDQVRSALPAEAQDVWMRAFNAAHGDGDSEGTAAAKAWSAVKNGGWHKNEQGKWVKSREAWVEPVDHRCEELKEALPLKTLENMLRERVDAFFPRERYEAWVREIYPDFVIIRAWPVDPNDQNRYGHEDKAKLYRSFYVLDGNDLWLSEPEEVTQVYEPVGDTDDSATESLPPEASAELDRVVEAYRTGGIEAVEALVEQGNARNLIDSFARWAGQDPGAFRGCMRALRRKPGITSPERLCAWLHKQATGIWPGQHRSRESGSPADAVLSEWVPLREASRDGKRVEIVILREGWGNPRDKHYYPREMLQREAASFAGVKMYADHPTPAEEAQRPERSIRDLVAVIESARYEPQGPGGVPAIVGLARIVAPWFEPFLEAAWQHLGVSINGGGKVRPGTIDGKPARIVEAIPVKSSVDFVTAAGAGGQVTRILESLYGAREGVEDVKLEELTLDQLQESRRDLVEGLVKGITLEQLKETRPDLVEGIRREEKAKVYGDKDKLSERMTELERTVRESQEKATRLEAENARLSERLLLNDQMAVVDAKLSESKLPEFVQDRLRKQFSVQLYRKDDGQLDTQKLTEALDAAIKDERTYIARLTESGKVRGMGASAEGDGAAPVKEQVREGLYGLFGLQGEEKPEDKGKGKEQK